MLCIDVFVSLYRPSGKYQLAPAYDLLNVAIANPKDKAWEEYNAQILLDARKNAGLTQQELAERIGADKGYVSRLERGLTIPSVSTLYCIAAAMGLAVEVKSEK